MNRSTRVFRIAVFAALFCGCASAGSGGPADGGLADGGLADGGPADGGLADGGLADGGPADGGLADGGPADGGLADGGPADGGLPACASLAGWTGVWLQPTTLPLVEGGAVRLRFDAQSTGGNASMVLVVRLGNVTVDASSARLDGNALPTGSVVTSTEIRVPLAFTAGQRRTLTADAVAISRSSVVYSESRLEDAASTCVVSASGAGATLQLLGGHDKYAPCLPMGRLGSVQMTPRIELASTAIYQQQNGARTDLDLEGYFQDTEQLKFVHTMQACVVRPADRRVTLSGMFDRSLAFGADDFFLVEVLDAQGNVRAGRATVYPWGQCIPCIGRVADGGAPTWYARLPRPTLTFTHAGHTTDSGQLRTYPAGQVDLSDLLPAGEAVLLRLSALDIGAVGGVSTTYLMSEALDGGVSPYVEPSDYPPCPNARTCL